MGQACSNAQNLVLCDFTLDDASSFLDVGESIEAKHNRVAGQHALSGGSSSSALQALEPDIRKSGYLGCCSIGTIVRTLHRASNSVRALKQIRKKLLVGDTWKDEVEKLQKLDHPNICKVHDAWEDSKTVYMVMELCDGGNLMSISAKSNMFSEASIAVLLLQMVKAVAHLHSAGVVHSNIRPENWLFHQSMTDVKSALHLCLKMIDFGLASKHARGIKRSSFRLGSFSSASSDAASETSTPNSPTRRDRRLNTAYKGTNGLLQVPGELNGNRAFNEMQHKHYMPCQAPEQVLQDERPPDSKADIWALGVIAYFLLSGSVPFEPPPGVTDPLQNRSYRNARYVFMPSEIWRDISREAKHFIALCLYLEPERRPTAEKLLDMPWMLMAKDALDREFNLSGGPSNGSKLNGHEDEKIQVADLDSLPGTTRLSLRDPPLPSVKTILSSIEKIEKLQLAERAAILAVAQRMNRGAVPTLRASLSELDAEGKGIIPFASLVTGLRGNGVDCEELEDSQAGPVAYDDFLDDVVRFQTNMQETALWYVFQSFDREWTGTIKKDEFRTEIEKESNKFRECIVSNFPSLPLDTTLKQLAKVEQDAISFEDLEALVMNSMADNSIDSASRRKFSQ
eukprot:TRINITY_DN48579_c0_g1_i1.p1 TRINITY_DN48579_c0_g1~~TRINITY_DN48579_c0_g1_i1.p1  ORF type:complete len:625 (-),score=104.79 TRINITY_DN48579_c0_g1_i1:56-1930(-)